METVETYQFEAQHDKVLSLVINSLYSEKDIFLRELVSNAADAISKHNYLALTQPQFQRSEPHRVTIKLIPESSQLMISDTGIGMSKEELISHLGTIARSGTHDFLNNISKTSSEQLKDLIGQFGVGFYSIFMVADTVDVISRRYGSEEAWKFSSEGKGSFSISPVTGTLPEPGTTIIAHMKDDEYLHPYRVRHIIQKYSSFAGTPIYLEHQERRPQDDNADHKEWVTELLNETQPLWLMSKSNIEEEQYKKFYQEVSKDFKEPLSWIHAKIEGQSDYTYLLYFPQEVPFMMFHQDKMKGVKLYVKHVFITDDTSLLLPRYLSFMSGVVDFADLPLNVSRELLQEHKVIERTKSALTKKVLAHLSSLATDQPEKYEQFWKNFGQVFKLFPGDDYQNNDEILPLLRFASTHTGAEGWTSLDDYIARMKESQEAIYYVTASTWDAAIHSPHMDYFRKNGIEVLLLTDRVDESLMNFLGHYKEKPLKSITRADLTSKKDDENAQDPESKEQPKAEPGSLCFRLEEALKGKVKAVRYSERLVESPCCLVVDHAMTLHMQRLLKEAGQQMPETLPILEINSEHKMIKDLEGLKEQDFQKWSHFVFSLALLAEGGQLTDPATFSKMVSSVLSSSGLADSPL